jgi:hypothetical protein
LVELAKLPPDQHAKRLTQLGLMGPNPSPVSLLFQPTVHFYVPREGPAQAEVRSTLVALALERYRRATGEWPATLAALVSGQLAAVPVDPFDGKPLRYRRLADGVVVYSIGPDGTDNGGRLVRGAWQGVGIDIGVQLWDVARRRQPANDPAGKDSAARILEAGR